MFKWSWLNLQIVYTDMRLVQAYPSC